MDKITTVGIDLAKSVANKKERARGLGACLPTIPSCALLDQLTANDCNC